MKTFEHTCPRCGTGKNSEEQGGHALCFHCGSCGFVQCIELVTRLAWKDAVIDAAVVDWVYTAEHEVDPRKCINDLLVYQQKIALDPAISQAAMELLKEGFFAGYHWMRGHDPEEAFKYWISMRKHD